MRGRKPKPAAVREAQGNPGRRRRTQPADPPGSAAPLADLPFAKLTEDARRAYDIIGAELRRLNFVRASDEPLLLRYCDSLVRFWRVTVSLDRLGGETYETVSNHGTLQRMRPEFMVQERLAKRLESMEDRLGLSPMARQQYLQRMIAAGAQPNLFPQGAASPAPSDTGTPLPPAPTTTSNSPIGMLRSQMN